MANKCGESGSDNIMTAPFKEVIGEWVEHFFLPHKMIKLLLRNAANFPYLWKDEKHLAVSLYKCRSCLPYSAYCPYCGTPMKFKGRPPMFEVVVCRDCSNEFMVEPG